MKKNKTNINSFLENTEFKSKNVAFDQEIFQTFWTSENYLYLQNILNDFFSSFNAVFNADEMTIILRVRLNNFYYNDESKIATQSFINNCIFLQKKLNDLESNYYVKVEMQELKSFKRFFITIGFCNYTWKNNLVNLINKEHHNNQWGLNNEK